MWKVVNWNCDYQVACNFLTYLDQWYSFYQRIIESWHFNVCSTSAEDVCQILIRCTAGSLKILTGLSRSLVFLHLSAENVRTLVMVHVPTLPITVATKMKQSKFVDIFLNFIVNLLMMLASKNVLYSTTNFSFNILVRFLQV